MEMRERLTEMREMDLQVQSKLEKNYVFHDIQSINMLYYLTIQIKSGSKENLRF